MNILSKLEELYKKYTTLEEKLSDPNITSDLKKYIALNKEYKDLEPIVKAYVTYKKVLDDLAQAKDILINEKDEELKNLARQEIDELTQKKEQLEEEIKILLLPADPQDKKNAIMEIRAGTGGDEASLFAGDLFRMYTRYAEKKRMEMGNCRFHRGHHGRI